VQLASKLPGLLNALFWTVFTCLLVNPVPGRAEPLWSRMPQAFLHERLPVRDTCWSGADNLLPGLGGIPHPSLPDSWVIRGDGRRHEGTDFVAARSLAGLWADFRPERSVGRAFASAGGGVSASKGCVEVGVWARSDYAARGADGVLKLLSAYKLRSDPQPGQLLNLEFRLKGTSSKGLRLGQTTTLDSILGDQAGSLRLTAAVNLFVLQRYQRVLSNGHLIFQDGYEFKADAFAQDSSKTFDGFGEKNTRGLGRSFDFGLLWEPNDVTFLNLSLTDVLWRASVDRVATLDARLDSNVRTRDQEGYLVVLPSITGRYSSNDLVLKNPVLPAFSGGLRLPDIGRYAPRDLAFGFRLERTPVVTLKTLWSSVPISMGCSLTADHEFEFRTYGLGVGCSSVKVGLRSSSENPNQARSFGWNLSTSISF
jgi:hypothetical protein